LPTNFAEDLLFLEMEVESDNFSIDTINKILELYRVIKKFLPLYRLELNFLSQ